MQRRRAADEAPTVKLVNEILSQAVRERASDIHIEPQENGFRIRFRIDGFLFDAMHLPSQAGPAVVSRVKIMADLDIAEKRLPQDGRISWQVEKKDIDFRVSTMPTLFGEKVVLRILDRTEGVRPLEELQMEASSYARVISLLERSHGIILVTGPTGSGKTTTLYAMLSYLNSPARNIITLEDPVEYSLAGVNQVQINPRIGLTFATGLRSVLRQDPNIIMVGEIRDTETARLATRAAMTGHLVLSTLHTNSAAGSLARLIDMGVDPYLIASSLNGVIGQRLVRTLCLHCREEYKLDPDTATRLGIAGEAGHTFYRGKGCSLCRMTGYRGRMALQEVLVVDRQVQKIIIDGNDSEEKLQEAAVARGMNTLRADGIRKARQGLTSLEEVMRVVFLGAE